MQENFARTGGDALIVENRHTGERLEMRRVVRNGQPSLALHGTQPPHPDGPPLHLHVYEVEEGHVVTGTLATEIDGRQGTAITGDSVRFPAGLPHRWWNAGDETLVVDGYATPLVDLDRYLHAVFEVLNAGPAGRPPLFYLAHLAWRHRRTQVVQFMPRPLQAIVLPLIVLVGTLLGRYRGTDWPGAPARCTGVPTTPGLAIG